MIAVPAAAQKRPNIVFLMGDDIGWNDFGAYTGGGAALGHPTPNVDRIAREGALFWIQASRPASRPLATDVSSLAPEWEPCGPPLSRGGPQIYRGKETN